MIIDPDTTKITGYGWIRIHILATKELFIKKILKLFSGLVLSIRRAVPFLPDRIQEQLANSYMLNSDIRYPVQLISVGLGVFTEY